jgi:bifunctional UDP-N-acetylglucosamine pyrophosphorylase/glucosamine-1-phosphate N-acetyltransferase
VRAVVEPFGAATVLQKPQLGTGHAVTQALSALPKRVRRLLILPGDAPLIRPETLSALLQFHAESGGAVTVLTARLEAIVEQKSLRPEESNLREVNSGIYCIERKALAPLLGRLGRDNAHREYYLTDAIRLLREAGERVSAFVASDPDEILGANTAAELARVDTLLRRRKAEALMAGGVTLYQPDTQAIDPDVSIGADSIVERGAELRGATRIGRRCHIGPFCILENAVLSDEVTVRSHSLVLNSRLASGVRVGPFAHLRATSAATPALATTSRSRNRSSAKAPRPSTSPISATLPSAARPTSVPAPSPATTTASTRTPPGLATASSLAVEPSSWPRCASAAAPMSPPAPP